ncbi:unnamed protein product [Parascedosporium putredinis]|uniref:Uncharacterized protein n=1 Tax=Parascedosporium putredinis TaxID=1442378 RepID=A0A9P1H470_9PEZI|nr:unnamed protein product [Parascedosporium putredinis]CAI7996437.1 unnamed protein product [Parascedosporium putredinis]
MTDPSCGLVLAPATPPMSRREKLRKSAKMQNHAQPLTVDKIWVANEVATMMISNWKETVEHISLLEALRPNLKPFRPIQAHQNQPFHLLPSVSEPMLVKSPEVMSTRGLPDSEPVTYVGRGSPEPCLQLRQLPDSPSNGRPRLLRVRRLRSRPPTPTEFSTLGNTRSTSVETQGVDLLEKDSRVPIPFVCDKENGDPHEPGSRRNQTQLGIRPVADVHPSSLGLLHGGSDKDDVGSILQDRVSQVPSDKNRMTDGASESVECKIFGVDNLMGCQSLAAERTPHQVACQPNSGAFALHSFPGLGGNGLVQHSLDPVEVHRNGTELRRPVYETDERVYVPEDVPGGSCPDSTKFRPCPGHKPTTPYKIGAPGQWR